MDDLRRPLRSASVKWRVLDEEGVLVDLETSTYFTLNPVGLFVWDRCNGDFSPEDIVDGLVAEFEVTPECAQRDLDDFLAVLAGRGLIEYIAEPAAAS
jgi:hypothetical protein